MFVLRLICACVSVSMTQYPYNDGKTSQQYKNGFSPTGAEQKHTHTVCKATAINFTLRNLTIHEITSEPDQQQ